MGTKRTKTPFIIILITIYTSPAFAQAEVGDTCVVKSSGQPGVCKISSECPIVQQQAQNGISPTICGFYQLTVPIVCCEQNNFLQPNENSFLNQNSGSDSLTFPDSEPPEPARLSRSEQKCHEFSKSVTGVVAAIPLLVTNPPVINVDINKCDYNGIALIVGGKPAQAGEFPFMAAIGFDVGGVIDWRCGGTLISDHFVVTAAHCTFSRDGGAPKVARLGELDLSRSDGSPNSDYAIKNIVVHPRYRYPLKYNDIALLQMGRNVKFTKFIRPACLHVGREIEQAQAVATGWGKTDYAATERNDKLMKVLLNLYHNDQCARAFLPDKNLPQGIKDTMLCAGEMKGGMDTCQGDSGGPLLVTKKSNLCIFYIVGITSFGKSCGQTKPAVYTRISDYVPWIEKTIW